MSSYVPPQHGAWAFLGLPLALGFVVAPWTPLLLVLCVAWIVAYPWSYAALSLVRARRPQRFRKPFAVWLAVLLPAVVVLVVARPWLVWVGLGYALLFQANLDYARRNDERAISNDLIFDFECALMVVVMWMVGAGSSGWAPPALRDVPMRTWALAIVCFLVLVGTTLHVKSLIRERRDPRYALVSRVYALACLPAAVGLAAWWGWPRGGWLVVPFVVLAVRAFLIGRKPQRAGVLGMIELGFFLLTVGCAVLACV